MKVEWMMEAAPLPYLRWLLQRRANEVREGGREEGRGVIW
jgi:hypothetical protein